MAASARRRPYCPAVRPLTPAITLDVRLRISVARPAPWTGTAMAWPCATSGRTRRGGVVPVPSGSPTPTPTPTAPPAPPLRLAYYALGDSIASGHGLPGGTGRTPTTCQQSPQAYPYVVAAKLRSIPAFKERLDFHRPLACSGAQTIHAARGRELTDLPDQVIQLRNEVSAAAPQYTLVSLTIGADNFDFRTELLHGLHICKPESEFTSWVDNTSNGIRETLGRNARELLSTNPYVRVVVTDYPNPFKMDSAYFPLLLGIAWNGNDHGGVFFDPEDLWADPSCIQIRQDQESVLAERTRWMLGRLNGAISDAVSAIRAKPEWADRIRLVKIYQAFKAHEGAAPNCGGNSPSLDQSYIQYPDFKLGFWNCAWKQLLKKTVGGSSCLDLLLPGSDCIHPNEQGAQVYANGSGSVGVFDAALELLGVNAPASGVSQSRTALALPAVGDGDCCTAHDGAGCSVDACQACVCAPDSTCCDEGWNSYCVRDANTVCSDVCQCAPAPGDTATATPTPTPTPGGDCAAAHAGSSCDIQPCAACVCGVDADCCTGPWDDFCVSEALGVCAQACVTGYSSPTPSVTPVPGGNCCALHAGPGCDVDACQACVCAGDQNCCDHGWDQFCMNIVGDTCALPCACAPTPSPSPTPTLTPGGPTATVVPTVPSIPTPGGPCCAIHDGPGCALAACQECVCGADEFCCQLIWDDLCVADTGRTCASACSCALLGTPTATPSQTDTPSPSPTSATMTPTGASTVTPTPTITPATPTNTATSTLLPAT